MRIAAIVVTYNPDLRQLRRCLEAVSSQVVHTIVVDNNSNNRSEILRLCEKCVCEYVLLPVNGGIATALNEGFKRIAGGSKWVLLLDQDSVVPEDYVTMCERYMSCSNVAIITSRKFDVGMGAELRPSLSTSCETAPYSIVTRTITSGAVVRMSAFLDVGGFDEVFFVDYVDFDFSARIRRAGYCILVMNDVWLEHQLGNTRMRRFLLWPIRVTEHSAERERTIAKNTVIYIKRYAKSECVARDVLSLCKKYILTCVYGKNRLHKIVEISKGIHEGIHVRG